MALNPQTIKMKQHYTHKQCAIFVYIDILQRNGTAWRNDALKCITCAVPRRRPHYEFTLYEFTSSFWLCVPVSLRQALWSLTTSPPEKQMDINLRTVLEMESDNDDPRVQSCTAQWATTLSTDRCHRTLPFIMLLISSMLTVTTP